MVMQVRRTVTPGAVPTALAEGQLGVNLADATVYIGVPADLDPSGVKLLSPPDLSGFLPIIGGNLIPAADGTLPSLGINNSAGTRLPGQLWVGNYTQGNLDDDWAAWDGPNIFAEGDITAQGNLYAQTSVSTVGGVYAQDLVSAGTQVTAGTFVQAAGYQQITLPPPDTFIARGVAFYASGELANLTVGGQANAGVGFCCENADVGFICDTATDAGFQCLSASRGFVVGNASDNGFECVNSTNNGFACDNSGYTGFYSGTAAIYGFFSNSAAQAGFFSNVAATGFQSGGATQCGFRSTGSPTWGISITTDAGKPGGGTWTDTSDERIKNIAGDYSKGLDAVAALAPKQFTYRGNDTVEPPEGDEPPYDNSSHAVVARQNKPFVGLVAQQVQPVFPEMVTEQSGYIDGEQVNDICVLDTTLLIYAVVNAIKELKSRVEQLESAHA